MLSISSVQKFMIVKAIHVVIYAVIIACTFIILCCTIFSQNILICAVKNFIVLKVQMTNVLI